MTSNRSTRRKKAPEKHPEGKSAVICHPKSPARSPARSPASHPPQVTRSPTHPKVFSAAAHPQPAVATGVRHPPNPCPSARPARSAAAMACCPSRPSRPPEPSPSCGICRPRRRRRLQPAAGCAEGGGGGGGAGGRGGRVLGLLAINVQSL